MGTPTPGPGERSFTAAVMREARNMLSKGEPILITHLNRRLT